MDERTVVSRLPIYTTNITGFLNCCCGVSLRSESTRAVWRIEMSTSGCRRGLVAIA
jgi:hypothetical protein